MALDDSEKEAIQDLLGSEGWLILWQKIIPEKMATAVGESLNAVRKRDLPGASESVAKLDGAVNVAAEAYRAVGEKIPDSIVALKRG